MEYPLIPFYNNGLQFECTQCSFCCRYTPGYVFLSHTDLERCLAAFHMERDEFIGKFCRYVTMNGRRKLSFREKENFDCIFWEKKGCSIYEHRPLQCRSYPFWSTNLSSPHAWAELATSCPGIGKGATHSCSTIREWLRRIENERYEY